MSLLMRAVLPLNVYRQRTFKPLPVVVNLLILPVTPQIIWHPCFNKYKSTNIIWTVLLAYGYHLFIKLHSNKLTETLSSGSLSSADVVAIKSWGPSPLVDMNDVLKLPSKELALHVDCKCMTWGKVSDCNYYRCLNQTFKVICQKAFWKFCRKQLTCTADPTNRLKTGSKQEVFEWLASAQSYLSSLIIKSFKVNTTSDFALQEAEATGDLFLGLYQEEDQFTWG